MGKKETDEDKGTKRDLRAPRGVEMEIGTEQRMKGDRDAETE